MTSMQLEKRTISESGRGTIIRLHKETAKYMHKGDEVNCQLVIEGNFVKMIVSKLLHNFGVDDIKTLAKKYAFAIDYDKTLGDVQVFNAVKNDFSLSYTNNPNEVASPANVILSMKLHNLDYTKYAQAIDLFKQLQNKFNVITRFEGDLDTINILKEPERYKLDEQEAFKLLKKANKQIGLSVIIRFDNQKSTLDEIMSAMDLLTKLHSKFSS